MGGQHISPTSSHTLGCFTCTSSSCCDSGVVAVQMELDYILDDTAHVVTCSFTLRIVEILLVAWLTVMQDVVSISPVNLGAVLISGILYCHSLWCCAVVKHHIVHAFWWCTRVFHWLYYSVSICHMVCVCACVFCWIAGMVSVLCSWYEHWLVLRECIFNALPFNDCSKELL